MRRKVVAGNWKMHGSLALIAEFAAALTETSEAGGAAELLLFPPAAYLGACDSALGGRLATGVQNLHAEPKGAFTGEHSAEMARELGAQWALVGHSERRSLFGETLADTVAKVAAAQRAGLAPVLCVGETLAERRAGQAETVVLGQLNCVLEELGVGWLTAGMIAYEPVWAIGTGETASPAQAQEMHEVIRSRLGREGEELAAGTRILYGGSVSPETAAELFAQPDIDGGLVGGASLQVQKFLAIAQAVE